MFNSLKKKVMVYDVENTGMNDYNEPIPSTLVEVGYCNMAISLNTQTQYTNNAMNLLNCEFIGITDCPNIQKGQVIDKKYVVQFVQPDKRESYVWLKEVGNAGQW